jgi:hypothetical protein
MQKIENKIAQAREAKYARRVMLEKMISAAGSNISKPPPAEEIMRASKLNTWEYLQLTDKGNSRTTGLAMTQSLPFLHRDSSPVKDITLEKPQYLKSRLERVEESPQPHRGKKTNGFAAAG